MFTVSLFLIAKMRGKLSKGMVTLWFIQIMEYHCYKKEQITDTHNSGGSQEHYVKWKKSISESHILYDFINNILKMTKL